MTSRRTGCDTPRGLWMHCTARAGILPPSPGDHSKKKRVLPSGRTRCNFNLTCRFQECTKYPPAVQPVKVKPLKSEYTLLKIIGTLLQRGGRGVKRGGEIPLKMSRKLFLMPTGSSRHRTPNNINSFIRKDNLLVSCRFSHHPCFCILMVWS